MSCTARENCNVFLRIFRFTNYGNGWRWQGKSLLRLNWWRWNHKNVWHDSVGKFWNRLVKCRIKHSQVQDIACDGELPRAYCFDCERYINE